MTNEMKLITALCEALGFEIKTTVDYQRREESPETAEIYFHPTYGVSNERRLETVNGAYVIDEEGYYTSSLVHPVVDFQVVPAETDALADRVALRFTEDMK